MMRTVSYSTPIPGTLVRPVRTPADEADALSLLMDTSQLIAFDTETAGLGFHDELRLVQFGTDTEAFCFEPSRCKHLARLLALRPNVCAHNAVFDAQHLARFTGYTVNEVLRGVTDTQVLAYIVDPRTPPQGIGHGLKALAGKYVDENAPDGDAALVARFKELGFTKSTGFAGIDIDDPTYLMYAGLDCIMTVRLHHALMDIIQQRHQTQLVEFDHKVLNVCAKMRERGFRVDLPYSLELADELRADEEQHKLRAASLGVENVNSNQQIIEALLQRGHELTERTEKGNIKVDKVVLAGLNDYLADEILGAKEAAKAFKSWVEPFLNSAHDGGRVRCNIKTGSVTYRLSASDPNMMNLPSGDWRIRRCLIPDEGNSIIASDFAQVELRTVALLAQEQRMIDIFKQGTDLHDATAASLFGADFTPHQRKLAKNTAFGLLYGGGPDTLARQAGVTRTEARRAIHDFYRAYPRILRWSNNLIEEMKRGRPVLTTHSGRRIPIDHFKAYTATNYAVQSLACDIFRDALIKLDDAGIILLLPVHDEIIAQSRTEDAQETAAEIQRIMSDEIDGIPFPADAHVVGPSWGHAYGAPEVVHV